MAHSTGLKMNKPIYCEHCEPKDSKWPPFYTIYISRNQGVELCEKCWRALAFSVIEHLAGEVGEALERQLRKRPRMQG